MSPSQFSFADCAPLWTRQWLRTVDESHRLLLASIGGHARASNATRCTCGRFVNPAKFHGFCTHHIAEERLAAKQRKLEQAIKEEEEMYRLCEQGRQLAAEWAEDGIYPTLDDDADFFRRYTP